MTELDWGRTVDRSLVHRDSIAEVLLTDISQVSRTAFLVAAQWPRSHRIYRPDQHGRHDPMLLLETVRQAGLALSHYGFGVPYNFKAIMHDIGFELHADAEPRGVTAATNLTVRVDCDQVVMRGTTLRGMTVILQVSANGQHFATGTGSLSWLSPRTFQALRARSRIAHQGPGSPATGLTPVASRHRGSADALICAEDLAPLRRRLLVPLDHPVYFDHPLDHVPGMLLIDGVWQAVSAAGSGTPGRLVECRMTLPAFTELAPEAWIVLGPAAGAGRVGFRVEQAGHTTAEGTLRSLPAR
ncbi:MAG TPA: ScbA/BarX family gamma-butyrolactone biosynthesis protein [Jatrophihabitans sp.]|nr:ScbA/BarX family gamma-butyrolactone biosynthesis protein [Jatrophihabitans sp.]